jgi:hypothetical protein
MLLGPFHQKPLLQRGNGDFAPGLSKGRPVAGWRL